MEQNDTTQAPNVADPGLPEESPIVDKPKARRGFACMDPEKVREIASKGGKFAHLAGTAHQFTSDEARTAGRKGGSAPHASRGRRPAKTA